MPVYLGEKAPDFSANTTAGPITLSQYKGQWVLLFSHPADFTPVCTTEFMAFAERYDEFKKLGVQLIGISIDSIYSHIAWLKDIKEKYGITIPFPVIADTQLEVARMFNMMDEKGGMTVRGVFLIDPDQKIRWMIYYPAEVGRNIDEIVRVVKAFKFNWEKKLATPVNWKEGDGGVKGAPTTLAGALEREKEGAERWYLQRVNA
ncbi:MAG: peroxiredoxin [Thermoplasmataceae archaeon]